MRMGCRSLLQMGVGASASHASASHLATLLLERAAGIKARHVAYRGAAPALNDVVGGRTWT